MSKRAPETKPKKSVKPDREQARLGALKRLADFILETKSKSESESEPEVAPPKPKRVRAPLSEEKKKMLRANRERHRLEANICKLVGSRYNISKAVKEVQDLGTRYAVAKAEKKLESFGDDLVKEFGDKYYLEQEQEEDE